jgi:hypothetical protein
MSSFHTVPSSGPVLPSSNSSSPSSAVLSGTQLSFTSARIREPPKSCQATDGDAIAVYDGTIANAALPLLNIACHVPSARYLTHPVLSFEATSFLPFFFSFFLYLYFSFVLYSFLWVIPRHLNFMCRRFGTLWPFHLYRSHDLDL